jgi:hypothetical protein
MAKKNSYCGAAIVCGQDQLPAIMIFRAYDPAGWNVTSTGLAALRIFLPATAFAARITRPSIK